MKIHFVSLNKEWVEKIKERFGTEVQTTIGDIEQIPREQTVFVSPANCLGFMDGGIDYIYSRKMFPGCEIAVKQKIHQLGYTTFLGRPYLPIGCSLLVNCGETTGLISAPTMFLPHDVSKTRNAYISFLSALLLFSKQKYETLVVTSLCCGYGKMLEVESAKQIWEAYQDFQKGIIPNDLSKQNDIVLMPYYDIEQPNNFDNREIKHIDPVNLLKV